MPRPARGERFTDLLFRTRYAALRNLDIESRAASKAAKSGPKFAEAVRAVGRDPADWPLLAEARTGGLPRDPMHKNRIRNTRYHQLRDLGATAREATEASRCQRKFDIALQRFQAAHD